MGLLDFGSKQNRFPRNGYEWSKITPYIRHDILKHKLSSYPYCKQRKIYYTSSQQTCSRPDNGAFPGGFRPTLRACGHCMRNLSTSCISSNLPTTRTCSWVYNQSLSLIKSQSKLGTWSKLSVSNPREFRQTGVEQRLRTARDILLPHKYTMADILPSVRGLGLLLHHL